VDLRKLSLLIEALRKILVNHIETLMNSKDSERLLIVKTSNFYKLKKDGPDVAAGFLQDNVEGDQRTCPLEIKH
jgi:hypothetical protein